MPTDLQGNPVQQIDASGATLTAGFVPVFSDHFRVNGSVDTSLWTVTTANGAIAAERLKTGTTADASAKLRSRRRARYLIGTVQSVQFSVVLEDTLATTNNFRRWGLFDDEDGWFFEQTASTLYAVLRRFGDDVKVPMTSWIHRFAPVLNAAHRYEIRITHLPCDIVAYEFYADGALRYARRDSSGGPSPDAIELPLSLENVNVSGGTNDVGLGLRGACVGRYGTSTGEEPRSLALGAENTVVKNRCGRLHRLIVGVPGANGDTVTLYNGTSSAGEELMTIDASISREVVCNFSFDQLYAEFSEDASCDVVVVFD